jgi:hypothetical protein
MIRSIRAPVIWAAIILVLLAGAYAIVVSRGTLGSEQVTTEMLH